MMASQEGESDRATNHPKGQSAFKHAEETCDHPSLKIKEHPDNEIIYERASVEPGTDAVNVHLEAGAAESPEQKKTIERSSNGVRPKDPSAWWVNDVNNEPGSTGTVACEVSTKAGHEDSRGRSVDTLAILEEVIRKTDDILLRHVRKEMESNDFPWIKSFIMCVNHMKPLYGDILARWETLRRKLLDKATEAAMDAEKSWSVILISLISDEEVLEQIYDSAGIFISGMLACLSGLYACRECQTGGFGVYYKCRTCPPPFDAVCKFCHDSGSADIHHTHEMEIVQNVTCVNCKKYNLRVYYTCKTCPEHYLCDKCHGINKDNEHKMEMALSDQDSPQCVGCLKVMAGNYFKCKSCALYILCQTCYDNGVEHKHDLASSFPLCNGCKERVVAISYSCRSCPDYGLCGGCHEQGIHKKHPMDLVIPDQHKSFVTSIFRCLLTEEHEQNHSPSVCDDCKGNVAADSYRCNTCPDYGLCPACHAKGSHKEHQMHRAIPDDFRDGLVNLVTDVVSGQYADDTHAVSPGLFWERNSNNYANLFMNTSLYKPLQENMEWIPSKRMAAHKVLQNFAAYAMCELQKQSGKEDSTNTDYLYHYSHSVALILESGCIRPSTEKSNTKFGKGVYFTELPPEVEAMFIVGNNYDGDKRHDLMKVNFAVRIPKDAVKGATVQKDAKRPWRNIWLLETEEPFSLPPSAKVVARLDYSGTA